MSPVRKCRRCGHRHERETAPGVPTCSGHRKGTSPPAPCLAYPEAGGKACRVHGGATRRSKNAAERARAELAARAAATTLGLPIDGLDPAEVVLGEIAHLAGEVAWYRIQVRQLAADDVIWGTTKQVSKQATENPGTDITEEAHPNLWVELLGKAQDRLLKACEIAHRMGIEERRVTLAEQVGAMVGETLRAVLADLDLTPEQAERAQALIPVQLRALAEQIDPAARL